MGAAAVDRPFLADQLVAKTERIGQEWPTYFLQIAPRVRLRSRQTTDGGQFVADSLDFASRQRPQRAAHVRTGKFTHEPAGAFHPMMRVAGGLAKPIDDLRQGPYFF